jgi:hypothetical protein
MENHFDVKVVWDADAEMWVADSDSIPGLAAEAPNPEDLRQKLSLLIPELLALNAVKIDPAKKVDVVIHYHREDRIQLPNAA